MFSIDTPLEEGPAPAPVPGGRQWSDHQQAIFTATDLTSDNLLCQAVAGSGKTTTLVEVMKYVDRGLYLAFNKSVAEELRPKAPPNVNVKTLNALGFYQWKQNMPYSELDARKCQNILKELMGDGPEYKEHGYQLSRVLGLAKNLAIGIGGSGTVFEEDPQTFIDIMENYTDIDSDLHNTFAEFCSKAFYISSTRLGVLDFDDQLYIPALRNWAYPKYPAVLVDEAQDLSPIQHVMLERLNQASSARLICVGDRHQAIYGFRGAAVNSMDDLKKRFSMQELPLSICYRCDTSIIAEAQKYCSQIEARPGAAQGTVGYRDEDPQFFASGELVICRNNAPLFAQILAHYRAQRPCKVLSNFLESFSGWIRSFKTTYSSDLDAKVTDWFNKESEKAKAKGQKGRVAGMIDKKETIQLFAKEFRLTADILDCLKRLGQGTTGPIFSTIHKAKGLEAASVYILRPDLMPAFYATSEDQKQQEANMTYVAITRAKHRLTYGAENV